MRPTEAVDSCSSQRSSGRFWQAQALARVRVGGRIASKSRCNCDRKNTVTNTGSVDVHTALTPNTCDITEQFGAYWNAKKTVMAPNQKAAYSDIGLIRCLADIGSTLLRRTGGAIGQVVHQLGRELLLPRTAGLYFYFPLSLSLSLFLFCAAVPVPRWRWPQ